MVIEIRNNYLQVVRINIFFTQIQNNTIIILSKQSKNRHRDLSSLWPYSGGPCKNVPYSTGITHPIYLLMPPINIAYDSYCGQLVHRWHIISSRGAVEWTGFVLISRSPRVYIFVQHGQVWWFKLGLDSLMDQITSVKVVHDDSSISNMQEKAISFLIGIKGISFSGDLGISGPC